MCYVLIRLHGGGCAGRQSVQRILTLITRCFSRSVSGKYKYNGLASESPEWYEHYVCGSTRGGRGVFESVHSETIPERMSMECHCGTTAYLSHQATLYERDPGLVVPVAVADLKLTMRIRRYVVCHGAKSLDFHSKVQPQHLQFDWTG